MKQVSVYAVSKFMNWLGNRLRGLAARIWPPERRDASPVQSTPEPEPEIESVTVQTGHCEPPERDVFSVAKAIVKVLNTKSVGGDTETERALRMIGPVVTDGFYEGLTHSDYLELPSICSVAFIRPDDDSLEDDKVYPLWGGILEVPVGLFGSDVKYDALPSREFQCHVVFFDRSKKKQLAICVPICIDESGKIHFAKVREKLRTTVNVTKRSKFGGNSNEKITRFIKTGKFLPSLRGEFSRLEKDFVLLVSTCFRVKELCNSDRNCEVSMSDGPVTIRFLDDRDNMKNYYPPKTRSSLSGKNKILHWVDSFQSDNRIVRGHYRGDDKFFHDGLKVRIRPMNWGYNPMGFINIKQCKAGEMAGEFGRRKRLVSIMHVAKTVRKKELKVIRPSLRELDKRNSSGH